MASEASILQHFMDDAEFSVRIQVQKKHEDSRPMTSKLTLQVAFDFCRTKIPTLPSRTAQQEVHFPVSPMADAPRKRKRVTPTLLAPGGADTGPAPAAVPAVAAAPDTQQGAPELEVVAKAVEQLQPLKVRVTPPCDGS